MAKIQKTSDSVIKVILRKDLKDELDKFATKKDLEMMKDSLRVELKLSMLGNTQRIEEKIKNSSDLLLTTFDPLLKELEQRQEDRELASYQNEQVGIQLGGHEKRIKVLEQTA